MSRSKEELVRIRKYSILGYIIYVHFIIIVVTISLMIFLSNFQRAVGTNILTEENISIAAKKTMISLFAISFLIAFIFLVYSLLFVRLPMKRIIKKLEDITSGDFSYSERDTKVVRTDFALIEEELNRVCKELSRVESLRDDFTQNISHEIKTPIAVIQNYAQLLMASENLSDQDKEYAEGIIKNSRKLSIFVTNVLSLTKLENKELYNKKENVNLSDLVSQEIVSYVDQIDSKNINLNISIEEEVYAESDGELLSLAISNILSNAVKFTPEGKSIKVSLREIDGKAIITIRDSGDGIKEEDIKHIFDKYFRASNAKGYDGYGLGLAMVKRIKDILNLEINVKSKEKEGCEFTIIV